MNWPPQGLTLETSASESLYGGQFTLSTQLIKPNYLVCCWYSTVSNESYFFSEPKVLFRITRPCTHRLTLNHLVMLGKYFLYINLLNNTRFVLRDFISSVQDKIEVEKYIHCCHVEWRERISTEVEILAYQ